MIDNKTTFNYAEVPQASPDSNNEATVDNKQGRRFHSVAAGIGGVLLVTAMVFCFATAPVALHDQNHEVDTAPSGLRRNLSSSQCIRPAPGDTCSNTESYGQCLHLESHGCKNMIATSSCPPQYQCADPIEPAHPIESQCIAPKANDECQTFESYQQCLHLEAHGCANMIATASCPPQYQCADPPQPVHPIEESVCGEPDDQCHTVESYEQCLHLEAHGCHSILATMSCPPQYRCSGASFAKPVQPIYNPLVPVHPIESQCIPPTPNSDCDTEESYQECLTLEAAGCTQMISTTSCPPQYSCASTGSARSAATPTQSAKQGFPIQPAEPTPANPIEPTPEHPIEPTPEHPIEPAPEHPIETNPCIAPSSDDDCHTQESYQQCLALHYQGCKMLMATRSCPPQYGCADAPLPVHPIENPTPATSSTRSATPVHPIEPTPEHPIEPTPEHPIEPAPEHPIETNPCVAPSSDDDCHTQESYQQCLALQNQGCKILMATMSCPPQYGCADAPLPVHPIEHPLPVHPIESQCTPPDGGCQTQESYQQCLRLETAGCGQIAATLSCPPAYQCVDNRSD